MSEKTTHFGFETIETDTKTSRVADVFNNVVDRYDSMNDLMSFGLHRWWKKLAIDRAFIEPDHWVLDLAGGTGDLTRKLIRKIDHRGRVILSDINALMLQKGRERLLNNGITQQVSLTQANAETLPFMDNSFDRVIMAFGLRNVTHQEQALREITRVLKPSGRMVILEFSKVQDPLLNSLYQHYSFKVIPKLGESYRYLVESIAKHPDQETLQSMMSRSGLIGCDYHNVHGGVVAIHTGNKP